ncbi:arylsulfatase [Sphingobacterium sp. SRCM116780]|uniref:arylsulfatase n=1 Tax=Sphingobacterium sp. SRCM116780 TaxID=2907623 RepID=UPI001F2F78FD|nr:arylsulfatase [Sphingobacterium sp. SRCM116780]UIR57616.1 arylsulfatase [Sphingobacterium sp. SRCM116780]
MKRNYYLLILLLSLNSLGGWAQDKRPNVVLILVDDLGFSDIEPYGATDVHTPNLTELANQGTRFQEFYNNSICAPTRASLLTGQYSHKAGIGYFNVNLGLPAYQGFLNKESPTLAEVLQQAGYSTIISGKWHVGDDYDQWPAQRGFERSFNFVGGASNFYEINDVDKTTVPLYRNNKAFYLPKDRYLTDEITDQAIGFLKEQQKDKKPFFLYLAFNAPHWPLQVPEEETQKYKGAYDIGWDSLRTKRYENAIQHGVFPSGQDITAKDTTIQEWKKLTYDEQQYWKRRQQVYAGMIDRVDQSIGKIRQTLKELHVDNNTVIIFLSDNGAQGGDRARIYTARNSGPVGSPGSYDIQNSNWSQTGNSPLRSYKDNPYEGGIGAPFIVWYPKEVKANVIKRGTGHLIDIAPTLYDYAQAKYPSKNDEVATNKLPGVSLRTLLKTDQGQVDRKQALCWERAGNRAVRYGKWKLVATYQKGNKAELYNIDEDRAENHNLATQYPEVVKQLEELYTVWARENNVVNYERIKTQSSFR